jgi:hypothetical protein
MRRRTTNGRHHATISMTRRSRQRRRSQQLLLGCLEWGVVVSSLAVVSCAVIVRNELDGD